MIDKFETYITIEDFKENIKSKKNISTEQETLILKALEFAKNKHYGQKRKTGHEYYLHPLAVANIILKLNFDTDSIIGAILHDTVEDTDATLEVIAKEFGENVATIVDGVTKLNEIKYKTKEVQQMENLRKLFIAMSKDVRVLIIKICDRLHNIMTMNGIKSYKKRRSKAMETLEIYAPLAERIGLYAVKNLLEDMSFDIINPEGRQVVLNKLDEIKQFSGGQETIYLKEIKSIFTAKNISTDVSFRYKEPYSIWKKMQNKGVSFAKIFDIIGYRIIVENQENCYLALNEVHKKFKFIQNSFMDYISNPKDNGYKSIHTSVVTDNGVVMEFQIRTKEMDFNAEYGFAAHWIYKDKILPNQQFDVYELKWMNRIVEILNSEYPAADIMEYAKLELNSNLIFVFTKKGDVVSMPQGSTILDFAFLLNENIGSHFYYAQIENVQLYSPQHRLKNGDKVEIFTSKHSAISRDWINFVKTPDAKLAILKILNNQQEQGAIQKGLEMLQKAFNLRGIKLTNEILDICLKKSKESTMEDFYRKIHNSKINPISIINEIFSNNYKDINNATKKKYQQFNRIEKQAVFINEIPNFRCFLSSCCSSQNNVNLLNLDKQGYILSYSESGAFLHKKDCKIFKKNAIINTSIFEVSIKSKESNLSKKIMFNLYIGEKLENEEYTKIDETIKANSGEILEITNIKILDDFKKTKLKIALLDQNNVNTIMEEICNLEIFNNIETYYEKTI